MKTSQPCILEVINNDDVVRTATLFSTRKGINEGILINVIQGDKDYEYFIKVCEVYKKKFDVAVVRCRNVEFLTNVIAKKSTSPEGNISTFKALPLDYFEVLQEQVDRVEMPFSFLADGSSEVIINIPAKSKVECLFYESEETPQEDIPWVSLKIKNKSDQTKTAKIFNLQWFNENKSELEFIAPHHVNGNEESAVDWERILKSIYMGDHLPITFGRTKAFSTNLEQLIACPIIIDQDTSITFREDVESSQNIVMECREPYVINKENSEHLSVDVLGNTEVTYLFFKQKPLSIA